MHDDGGVLRHLFDHCPGGWSISASRTPDLSGGPQSRVTASRPDIVDRNGEVLATDIKTASLFAEPRRIVDADEAIEKLSTVLPEIDYEQTYHKLEERRRLRLAAARS